MDAKIFFNPRVDFWQWQALKKISRVFLHSNLLAQFSISHSMSLSHAFRALPYPRKSVAELKSLGWEHLRGCSWWKPLRRTGFPTVSWMLSPEGRFFLRRQTLTSGWSLDVAPGRLSAASLLDCHEGSQSYKHLVLASIWCPETWLGLQLYVQIKDVDLRRGK